MFICRREALKVKVTEDIINLLSDVRTFLQDKCEPPVYVSDRRLVKAVAIMQVSTQQQQSLLSPICLMHHLAEWVCPSVIAVSHMDS